MNGGKEQLNLFLEQWQEDNEQVKYGFCQLKELLESMEEVALEFVPREGVTYSLRAKHSAQKTRSLFMILDVIEDTPRWISACFYDDLISDPEEQGEVIPGGLLGEDGYCFDMDAYSDRMISYLKERIAEAAANAAT